MMTSKSYLKSAVILLSIIFITTCDSGKKNSDEEIPSGGGGNTPYIPTPPGPSTRPKWVYAVYMAGDNALSLETIQDIISLEAVGPTEKVKIVVQAEFSNYYIVKYKTGSLRPVPASDFGLHSYNTSRFVITRSTNPAKIISPQTEISDQDMGNPDTLKDFIIWVRSQYPADHYALVLLDHGSGWEGMLKDDLANHYMDMPGLSTALVQGGLRFEVISFDMSLMGMYEVAYTATDHANYVVASEHTQPGGGDPHNQIVTALVANPDMTGKQLAQTIADSYYNLYNTTANSLSVTKSVFELSKFDRLDDLLGQLATLLISDLVVERAKIEQARDNAQAFGDKNHKDLVSFLTGLENYCSNADVKAKATETKNYLTGSVIVRNNFQTGNRTLPFAAPDLAGSKGMAIYLPSPNRVPDQGEARLEAYQQFAGGTTLEWVNFINSLLTGYTPYLTADGNFSFMTIWEDSTSDIDLYVFEPNGDIVSPWLGVTGVNGFISPNSNETATPYEIYEAKPFVMKGSYMVAANLFYLGGGGAVPVYFYKDNATAWSQCGTHSFNNSNPAPANWWTIPAEVTKVKAGVYSDWYIPDGCTTTK